MAIKLNAFNKLFEAEVPINITPEMKERFHSVKKALRDACDMVVKQPPPGKQLVWMTDARSRSAGYALMIKDYANQKKQSK